MTRTLADTRNALETSLDASNQVSVRYAPPLILIHPSMIESIIELHLQLSVIFRLWLLLLE